MKRVQVKQKWMAGLAAVSILLSSTTVGAFAEPALFNGAEPSNYIRVENNVSVNDRIIFEPKSPLTPLKKGDEVNVYRAILDEQGKPIVVDRTVLGKGTAKATGGSVVISLKNGTVKKEDLLAVTLTNDGKKESDYAFVIVGPEKITDIEDVLPGLTLDATDHKLKKADVDVTDDYFTVENNAGINDNISLQAPGSGLPSLPEKTVVTLYKTGEESDPALGKGVVKKDGSLKISLKDGLLPTGDGQIYARLSQYEVDSKDTKHESLEKIAIEVKAEIKSQDLDKKLVRVSNHVAPIQEEVTIQGKAEDGSFHVSEKDVFKVYSQGTDPATPTEVVLIGTATAKTDGQEVLVKLDKKTDLQENNVVWVTRTSYGQQESAAIGVSAGSSNGQTPTDEIDAEKYFEVINLTKGDSVLVKNPKASGESALEPLAAKVEVKIYEKNSAEYTLLGSGTTSAGGTATIKLKKDLPEIDDPDDRKVYITLTAPGYLKSDYIPLAFDAEGASSSLKGIKAFVTKNANKPNADELVLTHEDIQPKDTFKVYAQTSSTTASTVVIGTATAKKAGSVEFKLKGIIEQGQSIQITVETPGKKPADIIISVDKIEVREPDKTEFDKYKSNPDKSNNYFKVSNRTGIEDILEVSKLEDKMTVTVYDGDPKPVDSIATQIGKGVTKNGSLTISFKQDLSKLIKDGADVGAIYILLQGDNALEANEAIAVTFTKEGDGESIPLTNIQFINNVSIPDEVIISGLGVKDKVTVYRGKNIGDEDTPQYEKTGAELGTATAKKNGEEVTIKLKEQLNQGDVILVYLTKYGLPEGAPTVFKIEKGELRSSKLTEGSVTIINNAEIDDTITVVGLNEKDVIKIYDGNGNLATLLGSATAKKDGIAVVSIKDGILQEDDKIYISRTQDNKRESARLEKSVGSENKRLTSADLAGVSVEIQDNVRVADKVIVRNLQEKDLVKVYSRAKGVEIVGGEVDYSNLGEIDLKKLVGDLLASGTAKKDGMVTLTLKGDILQAGDEIWVTVSRTGRPEGQPLLFVVGQTSNTSEATKLNQLFARVNNNFGLADTIEISGLSDKDTVIVYDGATKQDGKELGRGVAKKDGSLLISLKTPLVEPSNGNGSVWISLMEDNKFETADRRELQYAAESNSTKIDRESVFITNNTSKADEVKVVNLTEKDIVKVYATETTAELLGQATAKKDGTVTIQLKKDLQAGSTIYVRRTSPGQKESVASEASVVPKAGESRDWDGKISIDNEYNGKGLKDSVTVTGLQNKDLITIYDEEGRELGKGTAKGEEIIIELTQNLPVVTSEKDQRIRVTLTEDNRTPRILESKDPLTGLSKINYIPMENSGESKGAFTGDIEVYNNVDKNPVVEVGGLFANQRVTIYKNESGTKGVFLGEGKAKKINETISITLNNQGKELFDKIDKLEKDYIIVFVSDHGKEEGPSKTKDVEAQDVSSPVEKTKVGIINNDKKADIITVLGLMDKDIITVYDKAGTEIGKATAKSGVATISIKELPEGTVSLRRKSSNAKISDAIKVDVPLVGITLLPTQIKSDKPAAKDFEATKPTSSAEGAIYVKIIKALPANAVVKAYVTNNSEKPLDGGVENNGILKFTGHSSNVVWLSIKEEGKLESDRVKVTVQVDDSLAQNFQQSGFSLMSLPTGAAASAGKSTATTSTNKQATTNAKLPKTTKLSSKYISALSGGDIYINGLTQGAIITAYDKSGRFLTDAVASRSGEAWLYIGAKHYEKYVWLTKTDPGKAESASLKVTLK